MTPVWMRSFRREHRAPADPRAVRSVEAEHPLLVLLYAVFLLLGLLFGHHLP